MNVEKILAALRGKRLIAGRLVNEAGCRCGTGELAHVAGVPDDVLRDAQTQIGETAPWHRIDRALMAMFNISPENRVLLMMANDHELSSDERWKRVVARAQQYNRDTEDRLRETRSRNRSGWGAVGEQLAKYSVSAPVLKNGASGALNGRRLKVHGKYMGDYPDKGYWLAYLDSGGKVYVSEKEIRSGALVLDAQEGA